VTLHLPLDLRVTIHPAWS